MEPQQVSSKDKLRAVSHIALGALYIVIGIMVLLSKSFGTIELNGGVAYFLSGLTVFYGLFRIVRGFRQYTGKIR